MLSKYCETKYITSAEPVVGDSYLTQILPYKIHIINKIIHLTSMTLIKLSDLIIT